MKASIEAGFDSEIAHLFFFFNADRLAVQQRAIPIVAVAYSVILHIPFLRIRHVYVM